MDILTEKLNSMSLEELDILINSLTINTRTLLLCRLNKNLTEIEYEIYSQFYQKFNFTLSKEMLEVLKVRLSLEYIQDRTLSENIGLILDSINIKRSEGGFNE